jgi:hypothetical protein
MNGAEFIRRVQRRARAAGVPVRLDLRHGKGSHGRLYYGARFTTVKDRRQEIGKGLLHAMLRQLGLTIDDLS